MGASKSKTKAKNDLQPHEIAVNEIVEAATLEYKRLTSEIMKQIRKELLVVLNEILDGVNKNKSKCITHANRLGTAAERKEHKNITRSEHANHVAAIKEVISKVKKYSHPIGENDESLTDRLLGECNSLNSYILPGLNLPEYLNSVPSNINSKAILFNLNEKLSKVDGPHDLLQRKRQAANSLISLKRSYIINSIDDLSNTLKLKVELDKPAFDALNKRRGDSKFWKVIDAILNKLKKSASTIGIKSASFQNKFNHSLFRAEKSNAKRPNSNRHVSDEKPSPGKR